jgi:hypothetical protein
MRFLFTIMLAVAMMAAATLAFAGEKKLVWVEYDGMRQQIAVDVDSPQPTHSQAVAADNRQVAKGAYQKANQAQTTANAAKTAADNAQTTANAANTNALLAFWWAVPAMIIALLALSMAIIVMLRGSRTDNNVRQLDGDVGRFYAATAAHINAPVHEAPEEDYPDTWEGFIAAYEVARAAILSPEAEGDTPPPTDEPDLDVELEEDPEEGRSGL